MFLLPISICVENSVLKTKLELSLVSTTFTAKFSDGTEKMLNLKKWTLSGLIRPFDLDGKIYLNQNSNTLFHKNWINNPTFGDFTKNYPTNIN
jgi:hypothetical protein